MSEVIPRVLQGRQVFETRHRRRDGQIIDVEVSAAGVEIDGERVLFAASRDISERKRAERELIRAAAELTEANHLKDIFTDNPLPFTPSLPRRSKRLKIVCLYRFVSNTCRPCKTRGITSLISSCGDQRASH